MKGICIESASSSEYNQAEPFYLQKETDHLSNDICYLTETYYMSMTNEEPKHPLIYKGSMFIALIAGLIALYYFLDSKEPSYARMITSIFSDFWMTLFNA